VARFFIGLLGFLLLFLIFHRTNFSWAQENPEAKKLVKIAYDLWDRQENLEKAVEYLRKAIALEPRNAEYYSSLGRCLLDAGRDEEALEPLLKALGLCPCEGWVEAWTRIALGEYYESRGDIKSARAEYKKALALQATKNSTREAKVRLALLSWKQFDSPHFTFIYNPKGYPARQIHKIQREYERAYKNIVDYLSVDFKGKIRCFLFSSRNEAKKVLGATVELGFARPGRRQIYVLYGEKERQTPGHEMTHVISFFIGKEINEIPLLREGLSVYLDQSGADHHGNAALFLETDEFVPLKELFENFRGVDEEVAYAEAGSFVGFLLEKFGVEKFKKLWVRDDFPENLKEIYGLSFQEAACEWMNFLRSSYIRPEAKKGRWFWAYLSQLWGLLRLRPL